MSQQYFEAREKYRPPTGTEFLLIAESPPTSGGYFYFEKRTGKDILFKEYESSRTAPRRTNKTKGL